MEQKDKDESLTTLSNAWKIYSFVETEKEYITKLYGTFDTVEDFWKFWEAAEKNHIDFIGFFKDNIAPVWEDPVNRTGGKLVFFFFFLSFIFNFYHNS